MPDKTPTPFAALRTPPRAQGAVRTGLEILARERFERLAGRRVGVVCNHTAVDRAGQHLVDLLFERQPRSLVALFGPEHSVRGDVDASQADTVDAKTGLRVFSLYNLKLPSRERYRPTGEMLQGIDTLVFDIQDIGTRYYTYISTLGYVLEEAAKRRIRVLVLDRPNPLGGLLVEGPLLDERLRSFTGYHTMPITHGLTIGELANLFNRERGIGAEIDVVKMTGWERALLGDQAGLPWVNPSPNIRNVRQVALYPGVGFLEVLPVSVGRGTDTPFEIVGAPWINGPTLTQHLDAFRLPGVSFVATRFTPAASTHKGRVCGGVQVLLWDRGLCRPSELGIHIAHVLARLYPEALAAPTLLGLRGMVGNEAIPRALGRGVPPASLVASWANDVQTWHKRRAPFLLYA